MSMHNTAMSFINHFNPSSEDVKEIFTGGCCYWFAYILLHRFYGDDSELMYDPIANHFGTRIHDKIYDITGDATNQYRWTPWYQITDESHRLRIIRDCINF